MQSQQPFNPYAPTLPTGNGDQIGNLRERVAKLEGHLPHLAGEVQEYREQQATIWRRLHSIEQGGAQAIRELPSMITAHISPLLTRLEKLEHRWWEPLRPHLWKIYLGVCSLAFAKGWRLVTGEPMPIHYIVEWIIRG